MRAFTISYTDIRQCPQHRWDPQHYNDDGTCKCPRDTRAESQEGTAEHERAGSEPSGSGSAGLPRPSGGGPGA